jgi:hypothetical protein
MLLSFFRMCSLTTRSALRSYLGYDRFSLFCDFGTLAVFLPLPMTID